VATTGASQLPSGPGPRVARRSAEERRSELIAAAVSEFAVTGYHGTTTEAIARRAGISHAYLFRLFATKKELFLACAEACFARTRDTFRAAAERTPARAQRLHAMGEAYVEMLADRELLRLQMQLNVAAAMDKPALGDPQAWVVDCVEQSTSVEDAR
jgi:AcrR family transcriptional regulator